MILLPDRYKISDEIYSWWSSLIKQRPTKSDNQRDLPLFLRINYPSSTQCMLTVGGASIASYNPHVVPVDSHVTMRISCDPIVTVAATAIKLQSTQCITKHQGKPQ